MLFTIFSVEGLLVTLATNLAYREGTWPALAARLGLLLLHAKIQPGSTWRALLLMRYLPAVLDSIGVYSVKGLYSSSTIIPLLETLISAITPKIMVNLRRCVRT